MSAPIRSALEAPRADLEVRPLAIGGEATDEDLPLTGPPVLSDTALYGPVGDWVRMIAPHTEASPAALLVSALVGVGAVIGRSPHMMIDGSRHGVNLFAMLIGPTGNGRKGTAVGRVRAMLRAIDPDFDSRNRLHGLSSGEGLIFQVRDPRPARPDEKAPDMGVPDKRLLVIEDEFASQLRRMQQQGNTLSTVIREAYDGGNLRTLTKADPLRATDPHIAIIASITPEELKHQLHETEMSNGFLNRFLPIWTERAQLLPLGSKPDPRDEQATLDRLASFVTSARSVSAMDDLTPAARSWWEAQYASLTMGRSGRVGAATQRGAPHVRRLALLFALPEGGRAVDVEHLEAALAVWQYAVGTATYVFGGSEMSGDALRIADALLEAGADGLDRSTIREVVFRSNSTPKDKIAAALTELRTAGLAQMSKVGTTGRSREVWVHMQHVRNAVPAYVGSYGRNGKEGSGHNSREVPSSLPSHISGAPIRAVEEPAPVAAGQPIARLEL